MQSGNDSYTASVMCNLSKNISSVLKLIIQLQ